MRKKKRPLIFYFSSINIIGLQIEFFTFLYEVLLRKIH